MKIWRGEVLEFESPPMQRHLWKFAATLPPGWPLEMLDHDLE